MIPYAHDDREVLAVIGYENYAANAVLHSVRDIRYALAAGNCVHIHSNNIILSPYCLPEEGGVVYFNIRTPVEWCGICSNTGRRVVYRVKFDKYVLYDVNGRMTCTV